MLRRNLLMTALAVALCWTGPLRADFPGDWQGTWTGACEATGPSGDMDFGMVLEVLPQEGSGALTWRTTYRMEGREDQVRDYVMVPTGDGRKWQLDERNGIKLDTFVAGEVLYQNFYFPTQTTSLTVRFERRDDRIELDIPSFLTRPGNPTTGPGGVQVVSFSLSALQRCTLDRQ